MGILEFSLLSLYKNHLASHFQTSPALVLKLAQAYKAELLPQPESTTKKEKQSNITTNWMRAEFWGRDPLGGLRITGGCSLSPVLVQRGQSPNTVGTVRLRVYPPSQPQSRWEPRDAREILREFHQFCVGSSMEASSHGGFLQSTGMKTPCAKLSSGSASGTVQAPQWPPRPQASLTPSSSSHSCSHNDVTYSLPQ